MDLSKLTYTKGDSTIELPRNLVQTTSIAKREKQKTINIPHVDLAYEKQDGILSSNLFFVLSGGEKKEKDFFKELIKKPNLHSLRVLFMSKKGQGLLPYQMQEKWLEIQKDHEFVIEDQLYHLEAMDKIFLLSDVDEFYDQLLKIGKDAAAGDQGQWIISNPCFEIWLYYCYLNNPEEDLAELKSLTVVKRSLKLKSLCQTVAPGGLNPRLAFEKINTGIENSKSHYDIDKNGIPVLFATQMHEMAQYLINAMNSNHNEYLEFVRQKQEWRARMRNENKNK
jgi:hypothetical protein